MDKDADYLVVPDFDRVLRGIHREQQLEEYQPVRTSTFSWV